MKKSAKKSPAKKETAAKKKAPVKKKSVPKAKKPTQLEVVKMFNQIIVDRNKQFKKLPRKKRVVEICKDAVYNILNGTINPTSGEYCTLANVKPGWLTAIDATMPEKGKEIKEDNASDNDFNQENDDTVATEKKVKTNTEIEDELDYDKEEIINGLNMQPLLPVISCDACAKGGLMISAISFKNKLSIGDVLDAADDLGAEVPDLLRDDFTEEEWETLEAVFERDNGHFKYDIEHYTPLIGRLKEEQKNELFINNDYGYYYEHKYFKKSSEPETRLLQMYLNVIAHEGDVMKAMSVLSTVKPNYKKIIAQVVKEYPIYNVKEAEQMVKAMEKELRPAPLSYKQIILDDSNGKI